MGIRWGDNLYENRRGITQKSPRRGWWSFCFDWYRVRGTINFLFGAPTFPPPSSVWLMFSIEIDGALGKGGNYHAIGSATGLQKLIKRKVVKFYGISFLSFFLCVWPRGFSLIPPISSGYFSPLLKNSLEIIRSRLSQNRDQVLILIRCNKINNYWKFSFMYTHIHNTVMPIIMAGSIFDGWRTTWDNGVWTKYHIKNLLWPRAANRPGTLYNNSSLK